MEHQEVLELGDGDNVNDHLGRLVRRVLDVLDVREVLVDHDLVVDADSDEARDGDDDRDEHRDDLLDVVGQLDHHNHAAERLRDRADKAHAANDRKSLLVVLLVRKMASRAWL